MLGYRTGWREAHDTVHRVLWIVLAFALALALGVALVSRAPEDFVYSHVLNIEIIDAWKRPENIKA
jgi:hypothetical protein